MSIHSGHRQRMKARLLRDGLSSFEEHEALELMLFYCIPRRDTNTIAHNLIRHFGSFQKVLDAPVKELKKVEGIGENAAAYLKMFNEVNQYYQISRSNQVILSTYDACGEYLQARLMGRKNEEVLLLCLDAKCMVLGCHEVGHGSVNFASVTIRNVVNAALMDNATSVVLGHNHPSGIAIPSKEDIITTKQISHALRLVNVVLNDHVVVGDDDYTSMALSGMYDPTAVYDNF